MILYFLVEPVGFDHNITERYIDEIANSFGVLPVIGYTDSPTLQIPGIYQLPTVGKDYGYDYEIFLENNARVKYNIEVFERYNDNETKSIWPYINVFDQQRALITCGTLDMLNAYIEAFADIKYLTIVPILLLQESTSCIDNFFYYYHGHDTRPSDIYQMINETDYNYNDIFTDDGLVVYAVSFSDGALGVNKFAAIIDVDHVSVVLSAAAIVRENVIKYFKEG